MEYLTYELLERVSLGFLIGVGLGVMIMQVSALGWMFWDMFRSKKDGS